MPGNTAQTCGSFLVSVLVLTACLFEALVTTASALPVVPDSTTFCNTICSTGSHGIINNNTFTSTYYEVAQTFTVSNSGILTALDLFGAAQTSDYAGTLSAYIVPTVNGVPTTDLSLALGSTSGTLEWRNPFSPFTLSGLHVPVLQGDNLAVVLAAGLKPGGTTAFTVNTSTVNYSSGHMFVRTTGNMGVPPMTWSGATNGLDLMFRTYVDCSSADCVAALDTFVPPPASSVPEPSAFLLLVAGIAGCMGWQVKRRVY